MKMANNAQKMLDQKCGDKNSTQYSQKMNTPTTRITSWMIKKLLTKLKGSIAAFVIIGH